MVVESKREIGVSLSQRVTAFRVPSKKTNELGLFVSRYLPNMSEIEQSVNSEWITKST